MSPERIPLWLDCDPGHDDAFAIVLAAYHPSLELLGISTIYGNAPLNKTTRNALSILRAIGMSRVPVHPGVSKPFCREVAHAPDIHGESGLDGTDLLPEPATSPLMHCNAIKDMRDALMAKPAHTAWLVTTGTLTNAALLFATYPEVIHHIRGLSIMGGAIGGRYSPAPLGHDFTDGNGQTHPRIGNWTPWAEFNIWCDPEAAQSIFQNAILASKTTLIPLDLTHQVLVTNEVRQQILNISDPDGTPTRLRRMFYELLTFFSQTYADVFGLTDGAPLHDPLAVAVLLAGLPDAPDHTAFDDRAGERWAVQIVLSGEELGRTKASPVTTSSGVTIPRAVDVRKFWEVLNSCLERADEVTGRIT